MLAVIESRSAGRVVGAHGETIIGLRRSFNVAINLPDERTAVFPQIPQVEVPKEQSVAIRGHYS